MQVRSLVASVITWFRFRRDRRHLLEMDDHGLRDLGLHREDVRRGVPFRPAPPAPGPARPVRPALRGGRA